MSQQESFRYTPARVVADFTEHMWNEMQVGAFNGNGQYAPGLEPEFIWDGGLITSEQAAMLVSKSFGSVYKTRVLMSNSPYKPSKISAEELERKQNEALSKIADRINMRITERGMATQEATLRLVPAVGESAVLSAEIEYIHIVSDGVEQAA